MIKEFFSLVPMNIQLLIVCFVLAVLLVILITEVIFRAYAKLLPSISKMTPKEVFAWMPIILSIPVWLFICSMLDNKNNIIINIIISFFIGTTATTFYDGIFKRLIKKIELALIKKIDRIE